MRIQLLFRVGIRTLVVVACLLGAWESTKILRSDRLYWQGSEESIRSAIRLEPDCWWCYTQLARLDDKDADGLLQTSLRFNPYNSDAAIDLGLRYEARGDLARAEKLLLQAYEVDQTYAPRWTLANFYFRRGNWPAFWLWARRAAEMPIDNIGALFELCWRVTPDPGTVEARIIENNPTVLRQYVDFLMSKDQGKSALSPALDLVHSGSPDIDRERLFRVTDRMIAEDDAPRANALWRELIRERWVVADSSFPNNPKFAREPLPIRFDWFLPSGNGLHSWPGPSGLVTEFTGEEPEDGVIAEQAISLQPGSYVLESSYHTQDIAANTGVRWEIAQIGSDTALAGSSFLSSNGMAKVAVPFSVEADHQLLRLSLVYRRQIGTSRISGTLTVSSIRIGTSPSK